MHDSLRADFAPPVPLEPKTVMARNAPCWCGSNQKWKRCHKDRNLQAEVPIGQIIDRISKIPRSGHCLHPEAARSECGSKTIKAHTVQRGSGLSGIAENGHVISAKKKPDISNFGTTNLRMEGIGIASTFMGFCSKHDNQLFQPIESQSFALNEEAAFLLSFRALSYEFLMKKHALETIEIQREMDKGKEFEKQKLLQNLLHSQKVGLCIGMRYIQQWKNDYDAKYLASDLSVPHYALKFDGILPFVCCGAFLPEFDVEGERLQVISSGKSTMEFVCLNVSVMDTKTFAVFSWDGVPGGPSQKFAESFSRLPTIDKVNALLHVAVEQLENTYFKPSWWNSLTGPNITHLKERMLSGTVAIPPRIGQDIYGSS